MERETKMVDADGAAYYRCDSFGQVAATVNLGHPSNSLSSVNGLVARYQAYTSAILLLGEGIPFPDARGHLRDQPDSGPGHSPVLFGGFGLYCIDAGDTQFVNTYLGAKQLDGRWLQMTADEEWVPFDREQEFEAVKFSGSNWVGSGTLENDTTGEEDKRARRFRFCLTHAKLALCGYTPIEYLHQRNINEFQKVMAILESIEFLDTAPKDRDNASSASSK